MYRKSNAGYELESIPFSAGRIYATSSGSGTTYDVNYHLTDQVGSVRAVVNGVGEVQQQSDYYAFGLRHASTDFATNDNRYQLTGKESQKDFGFNYLDFHARQYDPTGIQFTSQDPLQDEYLSIGAYNYCGGNPIMYIDPDGMAWAFYSVNGEDEATWNWVDGQEYRTGVKDTNGDEVVLPTYDAVVAFDGFNDEKLGVDEQNNKTLTGDGAKPASVTIFGINDKDDIQTYNGLTVSSDPTKYPMMEPGEYLAFHQQMGSSAYKNGALTYRIKQLDDNLSINPVGGINKHTDGKYMTEIFYTEQIGVARQIEHLRDVCLLMAGLGVTFKNN